MAAEVTNAALTIQSNWKRVEAATAARESAQKSLEAEQSKVYVGITTNFFVVQAQRDLRDAANTELRALADYRKSLVNYERAQQAPAGGGGGNFGGQQQQRSEEHTSELQTPCNLVCRLLLEKKKKTR